MKTTKPIVLAATLLAGACNANDGDPGVEPEAVYPEDDSDDSPSGDPEPDPVLSGTSTDGAGDVVERYVVSGTQVSRLPAQLPSVPFHLTARPFTAVGTTKSQYLARIKGEAQYWSKHQDANGRITDPIQGGDQGASPYYAHAVAILAANGDTSLLSSGMLALDYATKAYIGNSSSEFFIAPSMKAIDLYKPFASASRLATWRSNMNHYYGPHNPNNWATYTMYGEWLQALGGLQSTSAAISKIESIWNKDIKSRENANSDYGLFHDTSSVPDTLSVEVVGRGNLLGLIAKGYSGASAGTIKSAVELGTQLAMALQDPSGSTPTGGRTDDHVWVDGGYALAFSAMASLASDAFTKGQYKHAAQLAFSGVERWRHGDGSFSVTKNFFDPKSRVGYQKASTYSYNCQFASLTGESLQLLDDNVKEQPSPAEIGGYAFTAGSSFGASFANAGGLQLEIETASNSTSGNGNFWSSLGVVRIARTGWDTRLGPSDGRYNGSAGVSFAPTWKSGSSWVRLATEAGSYKGTFSTSFAHPLLTVARVVWAPKTAGQGPTFQQDLTITPDGVLSQTTCTANCTTFGMTLPLLEADGASTLSTSTSGGIASTQYSSSGDQEAFIQLNSAGTSLSSESSERSSFGDLVPVRAVTSEATNTIFVYPRNGSDPSASSVKSGFAISSTGFSSPLGSVDGTLYVGRTSAGGYGTGVDTNHDGTLDVKLSVPCNFIVQLSGGKVKAIEADRPVTATVNGKAVTLASFAPHTF